MAGPYSSAFFLFPTFRAHSAYAINYAGLRGMGVDALIFDIDNTLVKDQQEATPRSVRLVQRLKKEGFSISVVSNNGPERVGSFAKAIGCVCVSGAKKPSPDGIYRAMELMGSDTSNTILIGDQLFTDIWAANRAGIRSVLAGKIAPQEIAQVRLKRILEAPFRAALALSGSSNID